jgi:hypothetical protein
MAGSSSSLASQLHPHERRSPGIDGLMTDAVDRLTAKVNRVVTGIHQRSSSIT